MTAVGVVIPVYNEEHRVGAVLDKFPVEGVKTVVVVDDGSTDGTPAILKRPGVVYVRHEPRIGVGAAIRDGLKRLREEGCEVAVVMAGNGKDDPADIPKMTAPILAGTADYVQGSRFAEGGSFRNLPPARWLMIKSFTWLWVLLVGARLTDVTNGFRAYRLAILDDPRVRVDQDWLDTYEFEYYLHYKVLTLGFRFAEAAVAKNYPSRTNYSKIRPLLDWWSIVKPLFLLRLGVRS